MRLNKLFILYSLFGILMASCIKDEAPNAEADITGISFEEDVLASARFNLNPSYNDNLQAYPILRRALPLVRKVVVNTISLTEKG